MEIKKVTDFKELDELIPLIQKLHAEIGSEKYVSLLGYLSWIAINFPLENFQVWKGEKEGVVKGYIITQITQRYFVPECHIVDAFIEENDEEITSQVYQHIIDWAKSKGCNQLSINSTRSKAFERKYGFDYVGTTMIKKI